MRGSGEEVNHIAFTSSIRDTRPFHPPPYARPPVRAEDIAQAPHPPSKCPRCTSSSGTAAVSPSTSTKSPPASRACPTASTRTSATPCVSCVGGERGAWGGAHHLLGDWDGVEGRAGPWGARGARASLRADAWRPPSFFSNEPSEPFARSGGPPRCSPPCATASPGAGRTRSIPSSHQRGRPGRAWGRPSGLGRGRALCVCSLSSWPRRVRFARPRRRPRRPFLGQSPLHRHPLAVQTVLDWPETGRPLPSPAPAPGRRARANFTTVSLGRSGGAVCAPSSLPGLPFRPARAAARRSGGEARVSAHRLWANQGRGGVWMGGREGAGAQPECLKRAAEASEGAPPRRARSLALTHPLLPSPPLLSAGPGRPKGRDRRLQGRDDDRAGRAGS